MIKTKSEAISKSQVLAWINRTLNVILRFNLD